MVNAAQSHVKKTLKENPDRPKLPCKLPQKSQIIQPFLSAHGKHNSRNDHRTRCEMAEVV
jgi:hypothetical protein